MRKIYYLIFFIVLFQEARSQDNCAAAVGLCASNLITRTTFGATTVASDPAISCGDNIVNNSVWFTVLAINNGTCTITVSNIDNTPGLEMQVYSGTCGSLSPLGPCASGSGLTGRTMTMNFATVAGNIYYIMVDGTGGNQEAFDILATTSNDAIVARPDANFNTNPSSGCAPLSVQLQNTTVLHGGSNITYEWRFDAGPFVPATSSDTNIVLNTTGTHTATMRVCNTQCGCKSINQDIIVQDLVPAISFSPVGACIGTNLSISGSATIVPDPPYLDPAITSWVWDFGDPGSGVNNTASGQNVNHTFVGPGNSFNVKLVTQGTCGPDSVVTVINLRPKPTVNAGPAQVICEGNDAILNAVTVNLINPITYSWTGPGSFSCSICPSTNLSGLVAGGPYTATISVVDSFMCTADTTVQITVNPKPVVFAGNDKVVCNYSTVALNATPTTGNPPFTYSWSPSTGLNNSTIKSPTASITGPVTYCVQMTDSIGCVSDPDCLDINLYPKPAISPAIPVICASSPILQNTFTVSGAGAGSTYRWNLSPNYSLITASNVDSSSVTVTFPTGVAATYNFTVRVLDGVTGCIDTVSTSFTVITGLSMSISGPTQLCQGDAITLVASGATTYSWSASPAYAFGNPTLASQSVSPSASTLFTVTGTTGSCSQTINYGVAVNNKPTAIAQPIPPVCACKMVSLNGNGSSAGMTYSWTSASGNVITNSNVLATSSQACVSDVYTLRVTDPGSSCFKDTAVSVTVNPKPDANAFVTPNQICNGASTLITLDGFGSNTDPGTSYHWTSNNTGAGIADTTSISTSATVSTGTTFTLTVTDSQGCDSTSAATVLVYPPPSFIASNLFLCTSDPSLQSTLEIIGAAGGSLYNWTNIPPCVSPNSTNFDSQTFDFIACGTGSFTFDVSVTDAITTCVDNLSLTVQVVNGVNLTTSSDTSICEGDIATLFASGANTYLWNGVDTNSTINIPGLTVSGSPYSFIVSGFIGGCTADDTILVTVNPKPVTSPISGPLTACAGDTGVYYDVTPTIGNYTWSITGGSITTGQGSSVITVDWGTAGTGTLSVVDTNSFGCPGNTENITVTINTRPDSSTIIQGPLVVCENGNEFYFVNANPGSSYTWVVNGGTINGSNVADTISVNWGASGAGSVDVFEINSNACAGPVLSISTTINPKPTIPPALGDQNVCDSSQADYWTVFNAGTTLNWFVTGGNINSFSVNNDSINVTWTTPGTGIVAVTETNSFGCTSDTNFYPVLVNSKPQASASPDSAIICQNTSLTIAGIASGNSISWITSGTGTFTSSIIASPTYFAGNTDTGYVSLQMIVSSLPCPNDTATVIIYVSPSPVVNITGTSNTICYGDNDTLSAISTGNYLWSPGGSTNSTIVVSPPVTTTYYLTVTNNFSCSTTDSVLVTVNPPGIPDAGADQLICRGDSATFFGTQVGGGGYQWSSLGDGAFVPNTSNQQVTYVPGVLDTANGFSRIVLKTTGYCLNLTDTLILQINDLPSIDAGKDTVITSGSGSGVSIPLSPLFQNSTGVLWTSTGSGTFSPSDTALNAQYIPSDNDFTLDSILITASTRGSCTQVSDYFVIEFTPFAIPNSFSPFPGSAGQNDYFEIKNLPRNTGLKIWNRWGLLIFSTEDYLNNWEAQGQPAEIYYYVLTTSRKAYKGWVQVFRE